jgi:predicted short-subunit dehydrogenase-like oxidoreductase (DUF2520 family)
MRELERESPADAGRAAGVAPVADRFGTLAIVGPGRAGTAIAAAAEAARIDVALADRDGALRACGDAEAVLLCVPDTAIEEACESVVAAIPPLRLVGHVSGATTLDALTAASSAGARTFSLHPLQTLPDAASDLTGAPCAVAGSDAEAERFARTLGEGLEMRPFVVPEAKRAAYHAAASIASNFLVALEESAAELARRAGIEDAREVLAPLVLRSAANWADRGAEALTGPIARGDEATVERHRDALRDAAPELLGLYDELAERTRAIGDRAG